VVLSYKSRFLEIAIEKAKNAQTAENCGKPVQLDFKLYPRETVKVSRIYENLTRYYMPKLEAKK